MTLQKSIYGTDDFIGSTETAEVSRILLKKFCRSLESIRRRAQELAPRGTSSHN